MTSFKNSNQGRRMRDWQKDKIKSFQPFEAQNEEWAREDWQRDKPIRNQEWETSPAYLAAQQKVFWRRIHAYLIVGCSIAAIGLLMFWP